jgi:hypothetical protein
LVTKNPAVTIVSTFLFFLICCASLGTYWMIRFSVLYLLAAVHPVLYILALFFFGVISLVVSAIVLGPFYGGLCNTYIGLARGEPRSIGDLFVGFRRKIPNSMLGWLVPNVFTFLVLVLGLAPVAVLAIIALGVSAIAQPQAALQHLGMLWVFIMLFYFLFFYLPMMLFLTSRWFYVVPLTVDKQIGFWSAMGASWRRIGLHQWRFLLLWLLGGLICDAGFLLCGVGIFFTWPLYLMIMAVAYTAIFDTGEAPGMG